MSTALFIQAGDLSESFKKLVDACFTRVNGVLVEKTSKGFIVLGKHVDSMEKVEQIISDAKGSLNNSIKRA